MDARTTRSGIDCAIFSDPCQELRDFETLLQCDGFHRLDIALAVSWRNEIWYEDMDEKALKSGNLRRALAHASQMEHISLSMDVTYANLSRFVPLSFIFPIEKWSHLRRFGLSRIVVRQDDLMSFFASLPGSLRSAELSFLYFLQGNYYSLLEELRCYLSYQTQEKKRPRIRLSIKVEPFPKEEAEGMEDRWLCLDKQVTDFIYGAGDNPFVEPVGDEDALVSDQVGVIEDAFDPDYRYFAP